MFVFDTRCRLLFFFGKLKRWFPLDSKKINSLFWDSAVYSTEYVITKSYKWSAPSKKMGLLKSWLQLMCNECEFTKMEGKKKHFDWQPDIQRISQRLKKIPPDKKTKKKHLRTRWDQGVTEIEEIIYAVTSTTVSDFAQHWPMREPELRASSLRWLHLPYIRGDRREEGHNRDRTSETDSKEEKAREECETLTLGVGDRGAQWCDYHRFTRRTIFYCALQLLSLNRQKRSGRPVHLKLQLDQT